MFRFFFKQERCKDEKLQSKYARADQPSAPGCRTDGAINRCMGSVSATSGPVTELQVPDEILQKIGMKTSFSKDFPKLSILVLLFFLLLLLILVLLLLLFDHRGDRQNMRCATALSRVIIIIWVESSARYCFTFSLPLASRYVVHIIYLVFSMYGYRILQIGHQPVHYCCQFCSCSAEQRR